MLLMRFCRVTVAWLSADERKALRRALEVSRKRRQNAAERLATKIALS
jgi:hypothetical protein